MLTRARAQFFAAIAAGIAGCHPDEAPPAQPSIVIPSPSPSPSSSPTATPTAKSPALAASLRDAELGASPATSTGKLACPDFAKVTHQCVPPHTVPSTGGNVPNLGPYTSWDKNGCYQAHEIVGSCNGISAAAGPFLESGQCCFDVCQGTPAPCGRALVVEGRARVAGVIHRGDWTAAPLGLGGDLALRAQAARAWRDDAALEHASIASFARLSLELLALGAPPSLVSAAHQAAQDEVEHARVCFALAAELAGDAAPLGPGPLSLDGLALGGDLVAFAVSAAVEGCVGETVAALALSRAASSCDSPVLAAQLSKMADDELAHASLAWQCVAWACTRAGAAAHEAIGAALAVPDFDAPSVSERDVAAWRGLGRLSRSDMREVVAAARALVGDVQTQLFAIA